MSKFVIECPKCGSYAEASGGIWNTGIFGTKKIDCTCGYTIDVKTDKITSRTCAQCGKTVVFDQSKGEDALCPVCKGKINSAQDLFDNVEITCPSCACKLSVGKDDQACVCPLCDTEIDIQARLAKEKVKNQGLASVIKYEGDNQTFVWKHPIEDFNLGSQLIVHESQEAIFFRDGQALDLFGPGRYTLATQNLPLLEKLYQLPTNADTVFHSEIYFINQTVQMGIKWGTDSKVRLFDPATGLHIEIGACGQFSLKVCDSRKLVVKLVGTTGTFTQEDVMGGNFETKTTVAKFKAMIMTKAKSSLAHAIKENRINILEVDEHLEALSDTLRKSINEMLMEYGLVMPEFYVTSIITPDDDPNFRRMKQQHADVYLKVREEEIRKAEAEASAERQVVEAETAAKMKIISARGDAEALKMQAAAEVEAYRMQVEAEAEEMRMKGYTYQQETARQVGLGAVENMGTVGTGGAVGGLGDIAELGIALGAMGSVVNMTREAMSPMEETANMMGENLSSMMQNTWDCTCGNKRIIGNFCNNCGEKRPMPKQTDTWDCGCGNKGIVGNFCNLCGAKRPDKQTSWDCTCGNKGIIGNFCNMCGGKRPDRLETWDCTCGNKGIVGKFCSECGNRREEMNQDE